jgi:bacterioferritin
MIIKTTPEYFELLNKAVAREIQVAAQYILQHSAMEKLKRKVVKENYLLETTTFDELGELLEKMAIEEMKHLGHITERIYILGGDATTKPSKITIGKSVKEFMKLGEKAETEALELYREVLKMARSLGDDATFKLFREIYKDEEEHLLKFQDYLEIEDEIPEIKNDPPESKWRSIFTPDYITMLNKAIAAEISAIVQYTNQHEKASKEILRKKKTPLELIKGTNKAEVVSDMLKPIFMDEMRHLEEIAERIYEIDYEAIADVNPKPEIGATVDDWLILDRDAEDFAIVLYRDIIKKANEIGDIKTKRMFEKILEEEEGHYWQFDDYML